MNKKIAIVIVMLLSLQTHSQRQPKYTKKYFVSSHDTSEFKPILPKKDGNVRTFLVTGIEVWDVDDNNTTHLTGGVPQALVWIEGQYLNGKRHGLFKFFIIDSVDHSKKYKIWEQTFANDKLNGLWKTFNLKGTMVMYRTYKDDSLKGIERTYWIDGKAIIDEKEYINSKKFIAREYYESGKLKRQITLEDGKLNGPGKRFYESGKLMEEVFLRNGEFDKIRKYYHPNGQVWIEEEYKNGLHWNVIANYDDKGKKRNAGTLKNGNGTVIFYNDDGTVRETVTFVNGKEK